MLKKLTASEHFLTFCCRKIARRCGEKHIKMLKNCKSSEHFLTFCCRKIERRCGEKHIWKSECTKHDGFGALLSVQMSKNCTPLWWKAHLEVKMFKNTHVWTTFWSSDVEKLNAAVAKSTFESQNAQNTTASEHFCLFRCRKIVRRCGEKHIWKWKCSKTVVFGALFDVLMSKN